ncbi:hypothetical protein ABPG73_008155 [Tetrahymena malaccensis]
MMFSNQIMKFFSDQQIQNFLANNNYQYLNTLGEGDYSIVVQAYSHQFQANVAVKIFKQIQQDFELEMQILKKMKGERYILQIISNISDSNSNMNAIVTELYDWDSLKPMQILKLKSYLIENVIPNLKNQPNYDFIQNIVSQMIHYEQQNRLEPLKLIQILKSYKIEQDCLNQLVFPQKLKQSASLQQQSVVQQSNSQQIDQQIAQLPQYLKIYAQDKDRSKLNVSVIQKIKLTDQQVNLKYEKQLSNNQ